MKEGERARPGSTHQYINVLLLIQQRPHLLYIAVEDGLDQRRLRRKREASREGGTVWRTREGGEPAASRHVRDVTPARFSQDLPPRTSPPRLLLPELCPPAAPDSFLTSAALPAAGTNFQARKGTFLGCSLANRPRNHWKSLSASRVQAAALITAPAAHPQSLQQRAHGAA